MLLIELDASVSFFYTLLPMVAVSILLLLLSSLYVCEYVLMLVKLTPTMTKENVPVPITQYNLFSKVSASAHSDLWSQILNTCS